MGDRGGMKKHVEFEDDQHNNNNNNNNNNNKRGGSVTCSSSSFSSRTSSGGCSDDDDDLITLEDEFLTKTSTSQSPKQPEQYSDLTPPPSCQPDDHKLTGESYDSSRIPSAVFSSRLSSTAAADWSVASNESLFSLHMGGVGGGGNQSFSKDQAFLMNKSGELPRILDDSSSSTQQQQYSSGLASVTEVEEPSSNLLVKDDNFGGGNKNGGSNHALGNKSEDCQNSSVSPHSECSMHSNQSFAFPVFSNDLGRNKTVRLQQQDQQKSAKKRQQQQSDKEDEELQQNESKPKKASSFSKRSWISRCSCFSLPCK